MIPKTFTEEIHLEDGRKIILETGKLAKQAHGSVVVKMGKCMLLCTVVSNYNSAQVDFLPMTVDYREKFASAGRYPGGFFKREARPSDGEILTMRLVDRVLRPLFPSDYHNEVQIMIQLMSHDPNVMPDALAGLAASTAIQLSDIPIECPISEVRIGKVNGEFIINPSREQTVESDIDMVIGASEESVMMVEGEMKECSENEMIDAIKIAHDAIKNQINAQNNLVKKVGKKEIREYDLEENDDDLYKQIFKEAYKKCYDIARKGTSKEERSKSFNDLRDEIIEIVSNPEEEDEKINLIKKYFSKVQKEAVRELVLSEGLRLDGRVTDQIRPIWCEVDYLPSTHGSSIFSRGETQALATVTLGTSREANQIDMPSFEGEERFYLHYNFPPFSTGEARPLRGTSRREVGHGNLAQRALKNMIPNDCPYTVRVVSEILESNGSSSMATVCSGTMALMDAGIKIKRAVSGIAMGLISDGKRFAVLSDILGDEDHLGDMDFKVAGTESGITALQMDIKIQGINEAIMEVALTKAKAARHHILNEMNAVINKANELSEHTPAMKKFVVHTDKIKEIIGKGGAVIKGMQEKTGATVDINDDGTVAVFGQTQSAMLEAVEIIESIIEDPELNKVYKGTVVKIVEFGAFVNILPGKDGLLHISEIAEERTEDVNAVLKEGQEVEVKLIGFDRGKMKLSMKALLNKE